MRSWLVWAALSRVFALRYQASFEKQTWLEVLHRSTV